ncbi:VOC family protein [Alteromonadaceae bacterium M269]|nr:VOC family protein [Alteromonadaceae bacterium M269]
MSLSTYLMFNGSCRQAFEFYRTVFNSDFQVIQTFADAPPDMNVPDEDKDNIMHVSLPIGSSILMGSDTCSSFGPPATIGDNFSISYSPESKEDCNNIFEKLSHGGEVTMPLQDTFWGSYFGSLKDQFGVQWMLNFDTQQN